MAIESEVGNGRTTMSAEYLLELHKMGLRRLVPMSPNGHPIGVPTGTLKNGKMEYSWTLIYEDPNYWGTDGGGLVIRAAEFRYGVGVCLGDTGLRDEYGPIYHNVLDIDSDNVHDILFVLMNPGPKCSFIQKLFEEGFVVKTRKTKGYQIHWFSHKLYNPISTSDCREGYEFEILTGKTLANLPPTHHRKDPNFQYYWKVKSKIPINDEVYDMLLEVLNDCLKPRPEESFDQGDQGQGQGDQNSTSETRHDSGNGNGNGKSDGSQLKDEDIERIRTLLQPIYKKGYRYSLVFALSCVLRRQGICKDSVIEVIDKLARNDMGWQEIDVRKAISVVEDVFKEDIGIIAGNEYLRNVIYSVTGSRDKANEIFARLFNIIHEVQDRRPKEQQESQVNWLVKNVMTEYVCQTANDNGELIIYDEKRGVYLRNQEWRIRTLCRSIDNDVSTATINEVINKVKDVTPVSRSKFDSSSNIVNVSNGLLNIHTLEIIEHTPTHLSILQIPVKYDPKARCPKILKFLAQILKPEDIRVVLQLIGYCLLKTNKYERAFIFFGPGSNGKSTLLKLIEHFLGFTNLHKNVSHVSLHDLAKNRFKPAELYGKLANIFADLGNKKISSEHWGTIKMLISGDSQSVERKGRDPFEFTPSTKLIFSCNEIPELPDNTFATWRRLILLEFENVFEGENRDVNLIDKLTTSEEMSGLLNLVLQNLRQLIRNNEFDYTKDIEMVRKAYELNSNVMLGFANQCLETCNLTEYVIRRDVYGAFVDYCEKEGRPCKTEEQLGVFLAMHFAGKIDNKHRKRINGVNEYVYYGIRLKKANTNDS